MEFQLSEDKKELLSYDGNDEIVIIPSSVNKICSGAFKENQNIKKVIFQSKIEKIAKKGFEKCDNLEYIEMCETPEQCDGCSFCNCKNLKNTIIKGNTLIRVPISFEGTYIIPKGIEVIAEGAFCDCRGITDVIITDGVLEIKSFAFNGLLNLKTIKIASSVKSIETRAFIDCGKVNSIMIDDKNPKYDSRNSCNAIVETGTNKIIFGCSKTEFIDSICSIGSYAFSYCTNLEKLRIPCNISEIQENAFEYCKNLIKIETPPTLQKLESFTFSECENLSEVIINEGTKSIDFTAFYGCNKIKSLNVPNSYEPDDDEIRLYESITDVLPSLVLPLHNNRYFIGLPKNHEGYYKIPDGIEHICDAAFYECDKLSVVSLPDSLKYISYMAFNGCHSLLEIQNSSKLEKIESFGFADCTKLESIDLQNVKFYGNNAFNGCTSLKHIEISPDAVIDNNPFRNCPILDIYQYNDILIKPNINNENYYEIPSNVSIIADGAFENFKSLTTIILPHGIKTIGSNVFKGCSEITSLEIPDSVETIGYASFEDCVKLKEIKLSSSMKKIESNLFKNCIQLTEINLPSEIKEIGCSAFAGCKSLESIDFPLSLNTLGNSAFEGCTSIESLSIPYGITTIEYSTFKNCTKLTYIKIPTSVKTISNNAFEGCQNIVEAEMSSGWDNSRIKLGLPLVARRRHYRSYYDDFGATDDGPMAFTHGRIRPCPYCGYNGTSTYVDGTAQCDSCGKWFRYV